VEVGIKYELTVKNLFINNSFHIIHNISYVKPRNNDDAPMRRRRLEEHYCL